MPWIGEAFRLLALQAIPQDPDRMARTAQRLVFRLAGLFVSAVLVMLAAACLLLGLVFSLLPTLSTLPDALLILAALVALMGAVGWLVFANTGKIGALVSDTFAPPQRPLDMAMRKATRVFNAFIDGLEEVPTRNGSRR